MVLGWIERQLFERGLTDSTMFRKFIRPAAYMRSGMDPEKVHEMALDALNEYLESIVKIAPKFNDTSLHIRLCGKDVMPFGTAAGLDKNGDALLPLSYLFGFLEAGTVVVNPREGNPRPRLATDDDNGNIYNAQGFPSKGLDYFLEKATAYRAKGGKAPLLVSVCGMPPSPEQIDVAMGELETLVTRLVDVADGFVFNPFSPNTEALKLLRTPKIVRESSELITRKALGSERLMKIGAYDPENKKTQLDLIEAFLAGGGHGVVLVNTYAVSKEEVPSSTWGYPSAGRSGRFLQAYRQRAITDVRRAFPNILIIAAGGIENHEQAYQAFDAGANALEGYTPYALGGFGVLFDTIRRLSPMIREKGYDRLTRFLDR